MLEEGVNVRKRFGRKREATYNISVRKVMPVTWGSTWGTMGTFGPVLPKTVSLLIWNR